ncbi:MAG: hypothetical protein SH809_03445 [Rhodothermales bacterium]|nr:hypothetical protein [Rhodothermales bacterium]
MAAIPILLIIFGFVGFIVKWAMDHEQEKLRIKNGQSSGNTLTESELKRLIQQAVDEAVEPLWERLDRISPETAEAFERPSPRLLDSFSEQEDEEEQPAPRPRLRAR